jgi:hypothetical protein
VPLVRLISGSPRHRVTAAGIAWLAVAALAACGAPVAGAGASAPVPSGTTVFAASRPSSADCSQVDLGQLNQFSAVSVPKGKAELKEVDSRPDRIWASCVGRSPVARAADGSVSGGDVVWLLSFATSAAASSDSQRMPTNETADGFRTLVRPARLGDAQAQVVMDVHADDHQTLLVVTVFDPQTGRPAARCGLAAARGERADDAANWCLKALSVQLLRRASEAQPGSESSHAQSAGSPSQPSAAPLAEPSLEGPSASSPASSPSAP